jgi:hypothetical protein
MKEDLLMRSGTLALACAVAFALTTPTIAADLGGGCCADLEERVAELEATTAKKGGRKVTLTISGQVSKGILWVNEGSNSEHIGVDNFNSPSRFTFAGEGKMSKDWSAGYLIELGIGSPDDKLLSGADEVVVRHNALWIGTPIGKVWLGHTSSATDGIVEVNLANVNVAALPIASWTGFDGARTQVVKWESPAMAGFAVSASVSPHSGVDTFDAALRYAGEFSGIRFAAGVGYTDVGLLDARRLAGSASVMHVLSGVFATVNAGQIDAGAVDSKTFGGSAGIEKNFFGVGATTLFAEYSKGTDVVGAVSPLGLGPAFIGDLKVYGIGVVQSMDAMGLDLFANYRRIDVGIADDVDVVFAGARVKF